MRCIVARSKKAPGAVRTAVDYPEISMATSSLMWFPEVCLHRIVRTGFLSTRLYGVLHTITTAHSRRHPHSCVDRQYTRVHLQASVRKERPHGCRTDRVKRPHY